MVAHFGTLPSFAVVVHYVLVVQHKRELKSFHGLPVNKLQLCMLFLYVTI